MSALTGPRATGLCSDAFGRREKAKKRAGRIQRKTYSPFRNGVTLVPNPKNSNKFPNE